MPAHSPLTAILAACGLLLSAFPPTCTWAQERPVSFESLTHEDGLTDPRVFSILQDSHGFMWFGTRNGLNRYDGYEVRTFRPDPSDPNSISGTDIVTIVEDRQGTLWFASDGGLSRYDPEPERFTNYVADPDDPTSLSHNEVLFVYEDSRGLLWIATQGGGVNVLDRETGHFARYPHDPDDPSTLAGEVVVDMVEDSTGAIWVATYGGLSRVDHETGRVDRFTHEPTDPTSLSDDHVSKLLIDRAGALWLVTARGLNRFDGPDAGFHRFLHDPAGPFSIGSSSTRHVYEDSRGDFWVGTDAGIDLLDRDSGHARRYALVTDDRGPESPSAVWSMVEDGEGTLWVGTRYGVFRHDQLADRFVGFTQVDDDPSSLSDNRIRYMHRGTDGQVWIGTVHGVNRVVTGQSSIRRFTLDMDGTPGVRKLVEDQAGEVWVLTDSDKLLRVDPVTGATTPFSLPGVPSQDGGRGHWDMVEGPAGDLWIGSTEGLVQFDPETTEFTRHALERPAGLSPQVSSVSVGVGGRLWVGTPRGLLSFDPESSRFEPVAAESINPADAPGYQRITSIAAARNGTIWAGTPRGLHAVDGQSGEIRAYHFAPNDGTSISSDWVLDVFEDSRGRLWIATNSFLDRFDPALPGFAHYSTRDGLPAGTIYRITEDGAGGIWMASAGGLARLEPESGTVERFGPEDGIPAAEAITALHGGSSGAVYVGLQGGFIAITPVETDLTGPNVALTDLRIAGRSVRIEEGSVLARSITVTDRLELSHTDRVFTLEFASLAHRNRANQGYRYRLDPYDEDWVEVDGDRRSATYTAVPPGSYVFQLKASDHRGVWPDTSHSLAVVVTPPFWQTWWFRVATILALAVAITAYIRLRTSRLQARAAKLERDLAERRHMIEELNRKEAARLQAETKARTHQQELAHVARVATMGEMATTLAHELNQPLAAIVSNAQASRRMLSSTGTDPAEVTEALSDIVDEGNRASEIIRRLRAFLRRHEVESAPLDINRVVGEVTDLVRAEIDGRGIRLTAELADGLPRVVGDRVQLQQVLINLLINGAEAISEAGVVEGALEVRTSRSGGEGVVVEVRDNGVGIAPDVAGRLFDPFYTTKDQGMGIGLSICRTIVEAHGGTINTESNVDRGAAFRIELIEVEHGQHDSI